MKINKLIISKLHNEFDYSIDFNSDVTFLYGENGCGKTTILTIISQIISGKAYKLFDIDFKYIQLFFGKGYNLKITKAMDKLDFSLVVENKENHNVVRNLTSNYLMDGDRTDSELTIRYLKDNAILRRIANLFNQEFLPIRRSITLDDYVKVNIFSGAEMYRRVHYRRPDEARVDEMVMAQVNGLIKDKYNEINTSIKEIDEKFKVNVLKSFSEIYKLSSPDELLDSLVNEKASFINKIDNVRQEYYKILNKLNLILSIDLNAYQDFFSDFMIDIFKIKEDPEVVRDFPKFINLLLKYQELKRLDEIIGLANDAEEEKKKASRPLDQFLDVVNDFMSTSTNVKKKIMINREGEAVLDVGEAERLITLDKLSSGEKQIIIFFAHLILKIDNTREAIFIIDEPEMSLHPYWQKIFVDKLTQVNPNMQLIFATHSPEIIGSRRDKMVKLIRK